MRPRSPSTAKNDEIAPLIASPEPQDERIFKSCQYTRAKDRLSDGHRRQKLEAGAER
jgi:hypothetical protein